MYKFLQNSIFTESRQS